MPQSWNRFSYVVNNPLKFVDPDGEEPRIAVQIREPNYAQNTKFREDFRAGLQERLPVIGSPIATAVDSVVLSQFFPVSRQEFVDNANAAAVGMAAPGGGASAGSLRALVSRLGGQKLRVTNTNLPHAAQRAVERAGFSDKRSAAAALRDLGETIATDGVPDGTLADTVCPDRLLVPFGNQAAAAYQVTNTGKLRLKTVLEFDPGRGQ